MKIEKAHIITVLIALSFCALFAQDDGGADTALVKQEPNAADPNTRGPGGKTALHKPFLCDGTVRTLAESGTDVNAVCDSGLTPLMYAVSKRGYGEAECVHSHVEELLALGADPLRKTPDGRDPLIIYLSDFKFDYYHRHHRNLGPPNPQTAKLLLDAGINPLSRDSSGQSALSLALRIAGNHPDVNLLHETVTTAALAAAGSETEAAAVAELIREEIRQAIAERPPRGLKDYLFFLPAALLFCYVVFSAVAREYIYRGRQRDNWVGAVTGFITGLYLPYVLLYNIAPEMGSWLYAAAAAGLALGYWLSGKRETFNKYAALYYGLPLLLAVPVWGITLFFTL